MGSTVLQCLFKIGVAIGLGFSMILVGAVIDDRPIAFRSMESKTHAGEAIYNEVQFRPGWQFDTWFMRQSHQGKALPIKKWDRLAIIVDHRDRSVRYLQLSEGEGEIIALNAIQPKVDCLTCHASGPRAIRPDLGGEEAGLSKWDRFRITVWNMRIKIYGSLHHQSIERRQGPATKGSPLTLKRCVKCHDGADQAFHRSRLHRSNYQSIVSLIRAGAMPPFGEQLSPKEWLELDQFVGGRLGPPALQSAE